MSEPRVLKRLLSHDETVVFLGAGASAQSGLPLGDEAAETLIEMCFDSVGLSQLWHRLQSASSTRPQRWPRFEVVLDVFFKYLPSAPLRIIETFKGVGLSSTHQLLAAGSGRQWLWLTTNFDDQIETALSQESIRYRLFVDRLKMRVISSAPSNTHMVFKLHGDSSVADPDKDLGARIDQLLLKFPEQAIRTISRLAAGRPLLLIGYAARDPDLIGLLRDLFANASSVVWINRESEALPSVLKCLSPRQDATYLAGASPGVFENALGIVAPPALRHGVGWRTRVGYWLRAQDREVICQAIAALCLHQNENLYREAIVEILSVVSEGRPIHRVWAFETTMRRLIQSGQRETLLRSLTVPLYPQGTSERSVPEDLALGEGVIRAETYFRMGEYERAIHVVNELGTAYPQPKDPRQNIELLYWAGTIKVFQGGQALPEGIASLEKAMRRAHAAKEPQLEANTALRLAIGYMRHDEADRAENLLREIEPVFKEVALPQGMSAWSVNLSEALRIQCKFEEAAALNEQICSEAFLRGDRLSELSAMCNRALCLAPLGQVAEADRLFLRIARGAEDSSFEILGNAVYDAGWLRVLLAAWKQATPVLSSAYKLYRDKKASEHTGAALSLLGWCYFRSGAKDPAQQAFDAFTARREIVPTGTFRPDYLMLKLVLSHSGAPVADLLQQVHHEFADFHEQRFYLLMWIYESIGEVCDSALLDQILADIVTAIRSSKVRVYASVALAALRSNQRHRSVDLEDALVGLAVGKLASLRKDLAVEEWSAFIEGPNGS